MSWNKGDTILCVVLAAAIAFFGFDAWCIVQGMDQWASGAWTAFAAIFGGELLSFALYKLGKNYAKGKTAAQQLQEEQRAQQADGKRV